MQIPLSATLTSQHKAHPAGAFSRETRQLLCPVGHLLYKRRLFAWQTLYKNKNHAQNKHPECQHCTHRKRQTKAFASQRRTARNERIPPDGFRELCLGQYIPLPYRASPLFFCLLYRGDSPRGGEMSSQMTKGTAQYEVARSAVGVARLD